MKRLLRLLPVAAFLAAPGIAAADPGHERPLITLMRWADPPVHAAGPGCDDPSSCPEEVLVVKAHDPDSSITEIQVWFGEGAPFVFAHTGCVQGTEAGTPATLRIPVQYEEPGTYVVRAVALSHLGCLDHTPGDGHPRRHSPEVRLKVSVREA